MKIGDRRSLFKEGGKGTSGGSTRQRTRSASSMESCCVRVLYQHSKAILHRGSTGAGRTDRARLDDARLLLAVFDYDRQSLLTNSAHVIALLFKLELLCGELRSLISASFPLSSSNASIC